MEQTKHCVYCLRKLAINWSGHVDRKGKSILAGWCGKKHCEYKSAKAGFVGLYKWRMGREKSEN